MYSVYIHGYNIYIVVDIVVAAARRIPTTYIYFFAPSNGKSPFGHTHTHLYACKRQKLGIGPRARTSTRTRTQCIHILLLYTRVPVLACECVVFICTHTQTLSWVRGVGSVKWTQERRTAAGRTAGRKK
uniref:Uncharacterized protein n=1 Tax=Schizaphis graminum TaxID=13262 RepID=A0A2S2PFA4_SCHGA